MVVVLNMSKLNYTPLLLVLLITNQIANAQNKIDLQYVDYAQWTAQLKTYHSKIVVVDYWATWCGSCLERFPHMVEMNKTYKNKGVQFVSMLLEDPEEPEAIESAKQFLSKQFKSEKKSGFDHYFMTENLMISFEKLDLIGIPAVFIYDDKGELIHRLTGDNPNNQFTELDIEQALNAMLNDNKTSSPKTSIPP